MKTEQNSRFYQLAHPLAQANGTAHLLEALWEKVLALGERLSCTSLKPSGDLARGVEFQRRGQILFVFYVERYGAKLPGVAAISFSTKQFGTDTADGLKRLIARLGESIGVEVPTDGTRPFPVVGFETIETGRAILAAIDEFFEGALASRGNAVFAGEAPVEGASVRAHGTDANVVPQGVDPKVWRQIVERRGQQGFRQALLRAYGARCAVTGCTAVAALEAAHIVPYSQDPVYEASAGILLRADVHTLFDLHLLSVEPESLKIRLSPTIIDAYPDLSGKLLAIPGTTSVRPSAERFRWHFMAFERATTERS
jgi:hypothetical protein